MAIRLKQALILLIFSSALGLIINSVSGNGISLKGNWPSVSNSDSVVVPPSAEEGDPPFISLDEAAAIYQDKRAVFIDAREPEDFAYGHIMGAINIAYDYLPIENLEVFWDSVASEIPRNRPLVIYCSGSECESSLSLGRDMAAFGWTEVHVFYGGWREWERAELPLVREKE